MSTAIEMRQLAADLLEAAGLAPDRAEITARCIVQADMWGIASHGLLRLPFYLERMLAGGYPPLAELETVSDTGPVLSMTGNGGLGHWQLWHAAREATTRARQYGVAAVSVADSGHCGALGVYTIPGLQDDLLTVAFSNGPAVMPPWGGSTPVLSTSPIAAGVPTRPQHAIVDLATSAVARGKIAAHAASATPLPDGWALDGDGVPTTDPQTALRGMLSPLGGAKGFALAFLVESIAGGLAGPNLSASVPDMFAPEDAPKPQQIGHFLISIDPRRFGGDLPYQRLNKLAESISDAGGRLPGVGRTMPDDVPEDLEIDLAPKTLDELGSWATQFNIPLPLAAG